jgi:hypothetical protein
MIKNTMRQGCEQASKQASNKATAKSTPAMLVLNNE